MAAYAAVISLMHILDLIKKHPSPPISLDRQQLESLTEVVTFFQEFLEVYVSPFSYSDEADPFEMCIAEAFHAAEDVIESYIVNNIHLAAVATTTKRDDNDVMVSYIVDGMQPAAAAAQDEDEQIRYFNFYEDLQKVIGAIDKIKKEAMEMKMAREMGRLLEAEPRRNVSVDAGFNESKSEMVGFDDVRLDLLDRLTGRDSNRQIIPIVGMGGICKTTLARYVFSNKLIQEYFDMCLWATISQDYNIGSTLREVLSQAKVNSSGESVARLGEELYKCLFGRRYLVVLDDIWSMEVWDKMRFFFPENNNGSRVIVTTRISNLAAHLTNSSNILCMSFLNEVDSWTLFSQTVFKDGKSLPDLEPELREIGEKIVGKCKGLPLSIVVIGGLLAKSERTRGYWVYVEGNLSSIVNLDNEEYCLRVLKLSYNHLPAYLKPCFMYTGVFDEDSEIEVSTIINLWVSEGFVKPKEKKNLEIVAGEYLQELVDRNLVQAHRSGTRWIWKLTNRESGRVGNTMKWCKMHDLVRDVSLREAQKQRCYSVYSKELNHSSRHRCIVIPDNTRGVYGPLLILKSLPHPRSYVCHDHRVDLFPDFRLLRTLHTTYRGGTSTNHEYLQKAVSGLVNSRLLAIAVKRDQQHNNVLHSSISRLWSLHTLLVYSMEDVEAPVEFWKMHQLKHVEFTEGRLRLQLPPPNNENNTVIMENLHTLIGIDDIHLNEEVVTRIPNLRILDVRYGDDMNKEVHCLSYLRRLSKLESFRCSLREDSGENMQSICFPQSLKQILLEDNNIHPQAEWQDVLLKVGQLQFVEELLLEGGFFGGGEWETIEGQFPMLKTLQFMYCRGMKKWTMSESSHFPLLQKLLLYRLSELKEIPLEIGEIVTLRSIDVRFCNRSTVLSAKKIVQEQEDSYGEEELSFRVLVEDYYDEAVASLASPNFQEKHYKLNPPPT